MHHVTGFLRSHHNYWTMHFINLYFSALSSWRKLVIVVCRSVLAGFELYAIHKFPLFYVCLYLWSETLNLGSEKIKITKKQWLGCWLKIVNIVKNHNGWLLKMEKVYLMLFIQKEQNNTTCIISTVSNKTAVDA